MVSGRGPGLVCVTQEVRWPQAGHGSGLEAKQDSCVERGYMKVAKEAVRGALCRRVGVLACEDGDSLVEKEAEVMETFHKHNTVIL